MLSRVADDLYWFGRYLQRAENTARLVNVHAHLLMDLPRPVALGWKPLVEIVGADTLYQQHYSAYDEASVVRFLMVDSRNPGSIISALHAAREILRTVRDAAPREVWERLNDVYWYVQEHGERAITRSSRQQFLQRVIEGTLLLYGVLTTNMSRDVGFQFLRIGTNLEQADMTTCIIDVRSTSLIVAESGVDLAPFQNIQWMSVLRSLTAYQMYRRHVRHRVTGSHVLRFLLQNREFPRSVTFCLGMIGSTLPHLPQHRSVERTLWRVRAYVADANIDQLLVSGLHELIDEIQIGLGDLHEALSQAYFRS